MNQETYDFENNEYKSKNRKVIITIIITIINIIVIIGNLISFVFIEIPLLRNKKKQIKAGRYTKFKQTIENNDEQFDINENLLMEQ